ncbi:DUF58 domain-containing protein [Vibrio rarus]|uniref:DUF58 domain-containing protein n=1 Tax=Vibrio rarus TaxID=413403 RepID=UPI0021C28FB9|nr:DUF58 domain-containing protein [Vibrio rarus]
MFERSKKTSWFGRKPSAPNKFEHAIASAQLPHACNGVTVSVNELSFYQLHAKRWQPPAKSLWSQLNGQHTSAHKGQGMTFSEVRQYQAGDDVRQIDWRVTARTGKVHTKLFTEERERPVILFIDLTPSMFSGTQLLLKSVQMCHLASLLSWTSIINKDRVGAIIRSGETLTEIRPSSSKVALLQLLHRLSHIHNNGLTYNTNKQAPNKPTTLHSTISQNPLSINLDTHNSERQQALKKAAQLCRKGSELIILSDFSDFSQHDMTSIAQISTHNKVRAMQIYDPIELGETQAKGNQTLCGKEHVMLVNLSNTKVKQSINEAFSQQQQQLAEQFGQYNIALSLISSGTPILQQLRPHTVK